MNKVDPNTQEEKQSSNLPHETVEQAAIVTVCLGLYKYSRHPEGAVNIARGNISSNWLEEVFGESKRNIIKDIADYTHEPTDRARGEVNKVMQEALRIIRDKTGEDEDGSKTASLMTSQRAEMLLYLPPALHLSEHLNDSALDDQTNKMEGPVSNLVRGIEQAFSDSPPKK